MSEQTSTTDANQGAGTQTADDNQTAADDANQQTNISKFRVLADIDRVSSQIFA